MENERENNTIKTNCLRRRLFNGSGKIITTFIHDLLTFRSTNEHVVSMWFKHQCLELNSLSCGTKLPKKHSLPVVEDENLENSKIKFLIFN